jgi:uncharacterized membrane protein (DUF485 family)
MLCRCTQALFQKLLTMSVFIQAIGWVICVALGCFFAALVAGMVYVANRNVSAEEQTGNNSEVYSTAGRTISAGLTAADVV